MSQYEVLGLAEDESDERTIKRAYAKLLKQHRPDQDPEGFARIHQAYQRVMAWRDRTLSRDEPPAPVERSTRPTEHPAPPVVPASVVHSTASDTPDLWTAAVTTLTRSLPQAEPAEPAEAAVQQRAAIGELTDLLRQGLGSETEWKALVRDAIAGRWELALTYLDEQDCELLLDDLPLKTLDNAFKHLAKQSAPTDLLRLVTCWLSSAEQHRVLQEEDGSVVLRWIPWFTLLDLNAAMRLVALAEAGGVARKTVHQADRILVAGPEAKLLSQPLRWYVIGRILGIHPRHLRDPRVDEVVELTCLLPATHPLRALLMGPAAMRPKYQAKHTIGGGLDFGKILLGAPNILLFFAIFALIDGWLKTWIGSFAVVLCWGVVILWWRNAARVGQWFFGTLQPPYLTTGWAVTWFSYIGAGSIALYGTGAELTRWGVWLVVTLTFMRLYVPIRLALRSAISDRGWGSLIPRWHETSPAFAAARKLTTGERRLVAVGAAVWTSAILWGLLQVAPFSQPFVPIGISLVWLSGPGSFVFLAIRAWLFRWRRCEEQDLGAVVYWMMWTLMWVAMVLALPWVWKSTALDWPIDVQAPVAVGAMLLMATLAAALRLLMRKNQRVG